jgi:peptidoglycan/LPS O-acetylase OafA/YrhL
VKFRVDINGLRAIAIIGVVLYHFNHEWLSGGFSGVDVFFVISGFLMTSIIFRGLESNSFSLFKFYVDRANRIIPALAFLCFVLVVFGWFYLAPIDYKPLGKHVLSSMEFSSNVTYLSESGYFDNVAYSKWLLHTWSLSVEWQFYILFPVILIILKKFFRFETLKKLLLIATIISIAVSDNKCNLEIGRAS